MYSRSAELYDAIYSFKDYDDEAARLHELVQDRRPGSRTLLDVACGTGKHLAKLQDWYEVEGVDLEPTFVEIARSRLPGVKIHECDMAAFDLGRRFDVVTCLFSAVGYLESSERLVAAVATMARHLESGGLLVVEPWITPDRWQEGRIGSVFVDEPDLVVARMNTNAVRGRVAVLDMHHLVGTAGRVEHFVERHELTLFTHDEYLDAFRAADLAVEHHAEGIAGRGLYVGAAG